MDGLMGKGTRQPAIAGKPVIDPAAWYPADMLKRSDWIHSFSEAELSDLMGAVEAIEARGIDIKDITRGNFPLPVLGPVLDDIRDALREGRGFVVMRGLPIAGITRAQAGAAFYGIGTYLGDAISQNPMGHVLGHVKDLGKDYADANVRGYQTSARMTFHSDQCDYVGLLCVQPSKSGGESLIVSSVTLYNEMLQRRPDLAAALSERFYWTKHGEVKQGEEPWYRLAVFSFQDGYLSVRGAGAHITKAQLLPGVPPFTGADKEGMRLFQELANELAMPMSFEPGDMQFLHNHVMLHTRTAFEDWPEPERKRHLMRLWLNDPKGRPIASEFREQITGIEVEGTVRCAPLDMVEG